MFFKNLPLTTKILSLLLLLAMVSVVAAFFAGTNMETISDRYTAAIAGEIRAAKYLSMAEKQIVWVERSILQNIWALSTEDNQHFAQDTLRGRKLFHENLAHARDALPQQAEAFDGLSRAFDDVVGKQCAKTFALANAATSLGGDAKAAAEMNAVCEPKLTQLSDRIFDFSQQLSVEADARSDELGRSAHFAVLWTYVLILSGAAAILILAAVISKLYVVKPVLELIEVMKIIAGGNLSVVVSGTDRKDELGTMAKTVDAFRRSLADAEQFREHVATVQAEKSAQLQAANQELEAFSYSVSHDLRAPLRAIDGFSQALLEDYADRLDDQGRHYLNRLRQGSQQMGKLIDDLIQLSRLTRGEMKAESVNLSEIARTIVQEFREQTPERAVTFEIADNIVVRGDRSLLQAVMQNLLGNAWKFTSKHSSARIEFGMMEHEGRPTYFVRDDGAGFDMQYAGKLFGAFQRLHGTDEFPGTGVGLATVARIIHRHGGKIWAEAEVEKGATFYFTLDHIKEIARAEK